jgi:formiminotetrahydrofolate cyclodeaminase
MDRQAPLEKFLDAVMARKVTPGGGSVSALVGALGASLACMAARFSLPRTEDHPGVLASDFESASNRLLDLAFEDAAAYSKLAKALRLSKHNSTQSADVRAAVNAAAKGAAEVPLCALRITCEVLEGVTDLTEGFNPNLASDLAVGTCVLAAAARGLRLNVAVNLDSIADGATRERMASEAQKIEAKCLEHEKEALARIWGKKNKLGPT